MPVIISPDQLLRLAPNARSSYRDAFDKGSDVLNRYGISENTLRVSHFLAQVLHECGALTIQFENMNYSKKRLRKVWPRRFKPRGPLKAKDYEFNPEKLANAVYGGRMGNNEDGDGYKFRGRGLLQLTGRYSYKQATEELRKTGAENPDFCEDPDAVISSEWCLAVAAWEWSSSGCNGFADNDDIEQVTKAINGGLIGVDDRKDWLNMTRAIWA